MCFELVLVCFARPRSSHVSQLRVYKLNMTQSFQFSRWNVSFVVWKLFIHFFTDEEYYKKIIAQTSSLIHCLTKTKTQLRRKCIKYFFSVHFLKDSRLALLKLVMSWVYSHRMCKNCTTRRWKCVINSTCAWAEIK